METLSSFLFPSFQGVKNENNPTLFQLSFRSVIRSLSVVKQQVCTVLQVPPSSAVGPEDSAMSHVRDFQSALDNYLRRCTDTFNLERNCEEVLNQICSTLFDYPMIRNCSELVKYINNCVSTAWGLSTQVPSYTIEYEEREFRPDMHVKFHSSDSSGTTVRTYIWPALKEGDLGPVVHKAVVIT